MQPSSPLNCLLCTSSKVNWCVTVCAEKQESPLLIFLKKEADNGCTSLSSKENSLSRRACGGCIHSDKHMHTFLYKDTLERRRREGVHVECFTCSMPTPNQNLTKRPIESRELFWIAARSRLCSAKASSFIAVRMTWVSTGVMGTERMQKVSHYACSINLLTYTPPTTREMNGVATISFAHVCLCIAKMY